MNEQTTILNFAPIPSQPVTVLVADDSALIRRGVHHILDEEPLITVVGYAENFTQTLQLCCALNPRIVLLDLHMKDEGMFEAAAIKSELRNCVQHILAMSLWDDTEAKQLAEDLGAVKLLDKTHLATSLVPEILGLT